MGPSQTSEEDWGRLQELRGKTLKAGMQIPEEGAPLTWCFGEGTQGAGMQTCEPVRWEGGSTGTTEELSDWVWWCWRKLKPPTSRAAWRRGLCLGDTEGAEGANLLSLFLPPGLSLVSFIGRSQVTEDKRVESQASITTLSTEWWIGARGKSLVNSMFQHFVYSRTHSLPHFSKEECLYTFL